MNKRELLIMNRAIKEDMPTVFVSLRGKRPVLEQGNLTRQQFNRDHDEGESAQSYWAFQSFKANLRKEQAHAAAH